MFLYIIANSVLLKIILHQYFLGFFFFLHEKDYRKPSKTSDEIFAYFLSYLLYTKYNQVREFHFFQA